MKIKTKLTLGFVGTVAIMSVSLLVIISVITDQRMHVDEIVNDSYEKLKLITSIERGIERTEILLYETVLEGRDKNVTKELQQFRNDILTATEQLAKQSSEQSTRQIAHLRQLYFGYENGYQSILKLAAEGKRSEAAQLLLTQERNTRLELSRTVNELKTMQEKNLNSTFEGFQGHYWDSINLAYTTIVALILLGGAYGLWFIRGFSRNIQHLISGINQIAYGEARAGIKPSMLPRIEINSDEEIMRIASAVNDMAASIEEHSKKEVSYIQTVESQNWLMTSVAEVSTVYQGIQDTQTLASVIINKLSRILGAGYGAFYISQYEGAGKVLKKAASYAGNGNEAGADCFAWGEGLVGQCAAENESILIDRVPEGYVKIKSGLGEAQPFSLIVLPVGFENRALGVMEFATLEKFTELHLTLLNMVLGNIGITLNSVLNHMEIQRLLSESKTLTEELQTQSEELQSQQEELRSVNEELQEQNRTAEERAIELEKARALLEDQTQRLTLISQYKSDFLANMSHELRTPLNSLLILSQMLKENEEGNLNPQQVEYAETIYSAGHELLGLINNVLDLSKIESGKMAVHPAEALLSDIVSHCRNQFSPVAKQKGIEFFVRVSDDLPETIFSDDLKVKQILSNLVSNAIKFTERGSVILNISLADPSQLTQYPGLRNADSLLAFSVSDTGIGIPQDKIEMIFDAFEQADGTTSRKFGGTGLGLSISKELAALLGGCITVKSREGEGSMFTLYIPNRIGSFEPQMLSEKEIAVGEERAVLPAPENGVDTEVLKGKKVIVVDDDMRNIFALTTALEKYDMIVQYAENGLQAISILRDNPDIDLILMDLMMPELDGYETIKRIRELPHFTKVPIIAVTAKAMKNDRQKCIDVGASDYICKPVNVEQLYSLMLVWLCS